MASELVRGVRCVGKVLPGVLVLLTALAAGSGCDSGPEAMGPPDQTYRGVRGRVERPQSRNDMRVQILHEAIDDFVNAGGDQTGMSPMKMGFHVADGVSALEMREGMKVEMTFEVRWDSEARLLITQWKALPDDAELVLD